MLVSLASYPRSGNTFFRILLNACCGKRTQSIHKDKSFSRMGAAQFIGHEEVDDLKPLARSDEPYFVKTHQFADRFPGRSIYLYRDGRDAVVSFANYILSFSHSARLRELSGPESLSETLERVILGQEAYGKWGEHVERALNMPPGDVAFVRFEDLIREPLAVLRGALDHLRIPLEVKDVSPPTFQELNEKWPKFFRKGTPGEGREAMDDRLQELFWEHHGRAMERLNYSCDRQGSAAA